MLHALPVLEMILTGFGRRPAIAQSANSHSPPRELLPMVDEATKESASVVPSTR